MTLAEARAVLNKHAHNGFRDWAFWPWVDGSSGLRGERGPDGYNGLLTRWEAVACAERYLREEQGADR